MSFKKVGGVRNFGYGSSLKYAAKCALWDKYGDGRFGNKHTLLARTKVFIAFMQKKRLSDYRDVTPGVLGEFAVLLRQRVDQDELSLNTAVNYISAVNCLFAAMRPDRSVWISPHNAIGSRTYVRVDVPESLDPAVVEAVALYLDSVDEVRVAGVLRLCRVLGLRFREASLLRFRLALKEARSQTAITVTYGTKGGRIRSVPAGTAAIAVLQSLTTRFPQARNLIPDGWNFIRWSRSCYRIWRKYATELGVTSKFSDLRVAFACSLYEAEADAAAPVATGGRLADRAVDRRAREIVAAALGHGRPQIAGAYVGTSVAVKE